VPESHGGRYQGDLKVGVEFFQVAEDWQMILSERRCTMRCPRDGAELSRARIDGIELDRCSECEGLWLDRGELRQVCELGLEDVEDEIHVTHQAESGELARPPGYMRCPACPDGRLQRISITVLHPVRVDRCDQCLGLWLDRSELDAIVHERRQLDSEYSIGRLLASLRTTVHAQL
jgi:Zn-finger nucleic acid-binding protein